MAAHCYIICSPSRNRFYVGATQDPLHDRINKHNNHDYGNHRYTTIANDWYPFYQPHIVKILLSH